jgi:hypothetical protein
MKSQYLNFLGMGALAIGAPLAAAARLVELGKFWGAAL